jgi:hypothetical protein
METADYDKLPALEKEHFMECRVCGEMFDRRHLDEVFFHQDHKQRPDIQYSGSERVPLNRRRAVRYEGNASLSCNIRRPQSAQRNGNRTATVQ